MRRSEACKKGLIFNILGKRRVVHERPFRKKKKHTLHTSLVVEEEADEPMDSFIHHNQF